MLNTEWYNSNVSTRESWIGVQYTQYFSLQLDTKYLLELGDSNLLDQLYFGQLCHFTI
jgi:hypothetical protein